MLNRRDFLKLGGLAGVASMLGACSGTPASGGQGTYTLAPAPTGALEPTSVSPSNASVSLRIAHISDMHIERSGPGMERFAQALRHVHSLAPAVDFLINTGDCVLDALEADKDRAKRQWNAFKTVLDAECKLPIHHAIGNHDVWGWGLPPGPRNEAQADPLFGKAMALVELGLSQPYYAFDAGGWRFIVLDSTHMPDISPGKPYTGKLDDEQYNWLVQQLDTAPASMPVCVVSHIPILAACEYLDGDNESTGNWVVPGAWMHIDARRLWKLFWEHPNVKLCLSGHTHQVEDLRYHGVKYLTNGAISANWWNGAYFDFPQGYVVVTLYQDGTSASEFIAY